MHIETVFLILTLLMCGILTKKTDNDDYDDKIVSLYKRQEFLKQTTSTTRYPCSCLAGKCGCCTGFLFDTFRQKGCFNITYEPDEFAFNMALSLNDRVLYKNRISGKNPPPVCVRMPRLEAVRLCVKFSNLYFAGRNMHVCVDMELNIQNFQLFQMSFDCIKLGSDGVAVVPPEAGGGASNPEDEDDGDFFYEEYDDSARNL